MICLPKREKLDLKQSSVVDFAVAQDGNFYVSGEAGARKSVVLAGSNDIVEEIECEDRQRQAQEKSNGRGCEVGGRFVCRRNNRSRYTP